MVRYFKKSSQRSCFHVSRLTPPQPVIPFSSFHVSTSRRSDLVDNKCRYLLILNQLDSGCPSQLHILYLDNPNWTQKQLDSLIADSVRLFISTRDKFSLDAAHKIGVVLSRLDHVLLKHVSAGLGRRSAQVALPPLWRNFCKLCNFCELVRKLVAQTLWRPQKGAPR